MRLFGTILRNLKVSSVIKRRFFVGLGWEPRSLYVPDNQTLLKHGVPNLSFSRGVGNCDFDNVLTIKHLSYTLVITTARAIARTGEVFCDDPIALDVETETPLEGKRIQPCQRESMTFL